MQKKVTENKGFRTPKAAAGDTARSAAPQYPKTISELLRLGHKRLDDLATGLDARDRVLAGVRASLPAPIAAQVLTASFAQGRLSLGISSAAWASRARYAAAAGREQLGAALGAEVTTVRVRVARPIGP